MLTTLRRHSGHLDLGWVFLLSVSTVGFGQTISSLTDPEQPGEEAFVDIVAAWIEQDGGMLTFVMETRGDIPVTLAAPEDHLTFLWLVDADCDAGTGQPHEQVGSEFNVRAVISEVYGGGFVDVTGSMPGGGLGTVVVNGNRIQITVGLGQIGNPPEFDWACDAFHAIDNVCVSANHETAVASAIPEPYVPPARVTITTPLLMLCPSGPMSAQVGIELRDAGGNVLDNAGYHFVYHSTNEAVATVDASGWVTAHAVPAQFDETPAIEVSADGLAAGSVAIVRVTDVDLGVTHETYLGEHVAFYLPSEIEGVDLDQITTDYQVVHATDLAYEAQCTLTEVTAFGGGLHWFVLDVGNDGPTIPCGLSGNPVRLGWEYGKPVHNSCYIVNWPGSRVPQWGVIFHEMGHNLTWPSWGFGQFCSSGSPHDWKYSEALASMAGAWCWYSLQGCPAALTATVREGIAQDFPNIDPAGRQALADYRAGGSHYSETTPEVLCDILWDMFDDYGAKVWYDLFSTFVPQSEPLPCVVETEAEQATWVVAALSASAGEDLRSRFISDYGFPIDNNVWAEMLTATQARIDARPWQPPTPTDFNCDGDVDLADFGLFAQCFNGPNRLPAFNDCSRPDLDTDGDVDLADFGTFGSCFNGPNRAPAAGCP